MDIKNRKHHNISIAKVIWMLLEHNKRSHSIKIHVRNQTHYLCARCTGTYTGMLIAGGISIFYLLGNIAFPLYGEIAFWSAWLLAFPAIIDWSNSKLGLRATNNKIRVLTGLLLGVGIVVYFWSGWSLMFIILSLLFYKTLIMITVNTKYLLSKGLNLSDIFKYQKIALKNLYILLKDRLRSNPAKGAILDNMGSITIEDDCLACLACLGCCCCCAVALAHA